MFIDHPLALFIETHIRNNSELRIYTSNIPSMLFLLVTVISSISWVIYGWLRHLKVTNKHRDFFLLLGIALPLAYLVKTILKWVFGREATRQWLLHTGDTSLHWFGGLNGYDAFPSGHMLVITPIFLAVWFFYPRLRSIDMLAWLGLAILLIMTNYHFFSDVIAGAYIGMLLYFCVLQAMANIAFRKLTKNYQEA